MAPPVEVADLAGMFHRYSPRLHRYCASRVGPTAAEDVVAETFLVAHERRHRYDPAAGPVSGWLFGIATNLLRRHRRREVRALRALARTGVDPLVEDPAERAVARVDAAAQSRRVARVLAGLPRRQREVLLLFAVAELEYREIAAALGIPVGSVRSSLSRARVKIRAALPAALPSATSPAPSPATSPGGQP
jgi:RNA polymerase sigma-70 factor (ECF subfamily)